MAIRSKDYLKVPLGLLKSAGAECEVWQGGKHRRLQASLGELCETFTIPCSPSDRRGLMNLRARRTTVHFSSTSSAEVLGESIMAKGRYVSYPLDLEAQRKAVDDFLNGRSLGPDRRVRGGREREAGRPAEAD